jgi:ribulose-phosphate 3-epimerase
LVMSVMPGFGGQKFEESSLEKLARLDKLAGPRLMLSIDGGVNRNTIGRCAAAGASLFVVGTAFFGSPDYRKCLQELTASAAVKKSK